MLNDFISILPPETTLAQWEGFYAKLAQLESLGWRYLIMDGSWVSPARDCCFFINRYPYNGRLYRRFEEVSDAALDACAAELRRVLEL